MKRIIFFLFIILNHTAFSAVGLHLDFTQKTLKQGKIEDAIIQMDENSVQKIELQQLKGQSLADVIYLLDVSPLVKKDGGSKFEAEAKVIFLKKPEAQVLLHKLSGADIAITWSKVEIIPTETTQKLIFGQFEIPSRKKILIWFISLLILIIGIAFFFKYRRRLQEKKNILIRRKKHKAELMDAKEYSQIVHIWTQRDIYLKEFPEIHEAFKNFEAILFKYQFKPYQSEAEKAEVQEAYRAFMAHIQGGLSGI